MEEKKKADLAESLIENSEKEPQKPDEKKEEAPKKKDGKIFKRYKIKDFVFLAIMAACMLLTGAIMPLVGQVPVFGIVQMALGIQFSLFPTVGMLKVRKPGSLLFMALCTGVVLVFMNPIMFGCLMLCAFLCECLSLLCFRGYDKDGASILAGTLYLPLTLPFLYLYYRFLYTFTGEEGQSVSALLGTEPGVAVGLSVAVLAICAFGSFLGWILSKELKKAGAMKK